MDTFGNCQRPMFSLGVSQRMHRITNLWQLWFNWSSKLQENNDRKNTLVAQCVCFQMPNKRLHARSLLIFEWEITFIQNYVSSKGAISHNVLNYHLLSITQVSFYATNYFEYLPIVSSAFKQPYCWTPTTPTITCLHTPSHLVDK